MNYYSTRNFRKIPFPFFVLGLEECLCRRSCTMAVPHVTFTLFIQGRLFMAFTLMSSLLDCPCFRHINPLFFVFPNYRGRPLSFICVARICYFLIDILSSFVLDLTCFTYIHRPWWRSKLTQFDSEMTSVNWTTLIFDSHSCIAYYRRINFPLKDNFLFSIFI